MGLAVEPICMQMLAKRLQYIHTYVKARGKVSPRKSVVQSNWYYDVTSRVSDFQNDEQSDETDKNFEFIT